jgi:hypothetical protein
MEPKKSGQRRYRVGLSEAEIEAKTKLAKLQERMIKESVASVPAGTDLNKSTVIRSCYECSSCGRWPKDSRAHPTPAGSLSAPTAVARKARSRVSFYPQQKTVVGGKTPFAPKAEKNSAVESMSVLKAENPKCSA